MKDKAIAKITEEAMKIDDPIAFAIEEYLTGKIRTNAEAALILAEDKTLKGAYDKVWAEARKRKKGNCAYIPPEEVYEIIDEYYGLHSSRKADHRGEAAEKVDVLDLF